MYCKDLEMYRKQTKAYEVVFKKDGQTTDITGWTVYMVIKTKMEDTDVQALLIKKVTSHTDPTGGRTIIELSSSDTDITMGNHYYSIDYKTDEGDEGVLFHGRMRVIEPTLQNRD